MTLVELLSTLHKRDIRLWVEDGRLRYDAPAGSLTPDLLALLKQKKADLIALLQEIRQDSTRTVLRPAERGANVELSFAQQRLWLIDQMEPGNPAYNLPAAIRLTGRLDQRALEQSLNLLIERHEILRTSFALSEHGPRQVIAPSQPLALTLHDLQAHNPASREATIREIISAETLRPFSLADGPLLRAALLRLDQDDHVLLIVMHHIITDGWSMGIVVRELGSFYAAAVARSSAALPPLAIQYADYAVWQRQWLQGEILERQMAYWTSQLADLATLELPLDRPRPARASYRGASLAIALPVELSQRLQRFSQAEGATLFMTLLAAWQLLLHRYSRQSDIAVGTPIAGRTQPEVEPLIGFFVNTLVLRTDVAQQRSFRELLRRVRTLTLEAYAHQDLPFELLVEALQPERDLSRHPLFQVLFALQNMPIERLEAPGLNLSPLAIEQATTQFDLSLILVETDTGLTGTLQYSSDLFDPGTIERMAAHFQILLAAAIAQPDRPIAELSLLSEAEREQVLTRFTPTPQVFPAHTTLHERFEQQVVRTPQAIALTCGDQQLSYADLNQRANTLAYRLRDLGVQPETRVGLCVERSLDLVVGLLGILKAGAAYVPLDPAYPPERLHFMIADAQLAILVTQSALQQHLPPTATTVCIDALPLDARAQLNPRSGVTPDHLAYVIYTSGSTGQPKGSLITHANVARLFAATEPWFKFGSQDVWTLFHSYAFDFSVWEIWGALLYGGRLVIVPYLTSRDPAAFVALLHAEQVTVLNQTPSAFRQVVAAERQRGGAPGDLALRLVIFGGEALDLATLQPWFERHGDQRPQLVNMYGITETTVHVTYRPITAADLELARGSVIGGPIPDLRLYLLDAQMQPVPVGVAGELYVGGAGLARGYLGRPELTAERFVPDPFSNDSGARLYKTGDLARSSADGDLAYLGRIDQQVKLRGFRIELGEIAAVIERHPSVREAAVLVAGEGEAQRLVAYVVENQEPRTKNQEPRTETPKGYPERRTENGEQRAENGEPGNRVPHGEHLGTPVSREARAGAERQERLAAELRSFVQQQLPDYMVPSAFVVVDALPLTPNGKLDRKALLALDTGSLSADHAYVPPQNALELQLVQIWESVLQQRPIGVTDNFFERGGNSLIAVRLISQIERQLGQQLPLTTIFAHPTIRELASTLLERGWPGVLHLIDELPQHKSPLVAIQPNGSRPPFFFVAPLGGILPSNVLSGIIDLASHLGSDQPYYGVQLPGLAYDLIPNLDTHKLVDAEYLQSLAQALTDASRVIESRAAECVAAIRAAQPAGPYLIGGFCTGSIIAFEIACQLQRQGQPVALLALVDPPLSLSRDNNAPSSVTEARSDSVSAALAKLSQPDPEEAAWFINRDLGGNRLPDDLETMTATLRQLDPAAWWDYAAEQLRQSNAGIRAVDPQEIRRLFSIYQVNILSLNAILSTYTADVFAGRITVLQVADMYEQADDARSRWQQLATQPVESHVIPGDHGTLFHEPNIQVFAQLLRDSLGGALAASDLHGTDRASSAQSLAGNADELLLAPVPRDMPLPLSFAQQRLWFLDQLEPGSAAYHIPTVVRLSGDLDPAALQQALTVLSARHESLRTVFPQQSGQPIQKILPPGPVAVELVTVPPLPQPARDLWLRQWVRAEVQRPFDLQNGPLLRAALLELSATEHVLALTLHHIITDGWSQQLLLQELTELYQRCLSRQPIDLPALPIQYADYAVWQRQTLQGEVLERQLSYWRQQLADLPPLELPTDRPRPALMSYAGAAVQVQLPAALSHVLQRFSQQHSATPFMTLLAAWQTLLYRYSDQHDLAVGTPIAGRVRPELDNLIGCFVNTLVLRTKLSAATSFAELLARVRAICLEAYAHQDLPFELLVEALQPERDTSRAPLFQVLFALQNTPQARIDLPELQLEPLALESSTAKFDLTLTLAETPQGIEGALLYRSDLFDPDTIERMAAHFQTLLAAAITQPQRQIADLPLLTDAEYRRMVADQVESITDYRQDRCVHHLFEAQAERRPDAVALVFEATALSYRELNRRANQLAHALQARGAGPDTPVAICVERSAEMIVGLLAILKAGAAYLPLDPAFPAGRLELMLQDAGARLVLTQRALSGSLPAGIARICLDDDWPAIARQPETNPGSAVTPEHLAYLIYTSGSTGRPKGVAIEHRSLHHYVDAILERLDLPEGASFATVSTIAADLGNTAIYAALCSGGTLHVIAQDRLTDPAALAEYCVQQPIDCLKIVPSHLAALLSAGSGATILPRRRLVLGGEASSWQLIEQVQRLAPGCAILNHYGPTESTVGVLSFSVEREQARPQTLTLPIGRPLGTTQCYILDPQMQPVPPGMAGELYIGGVQVARGYHGRPDLTAERFVPHPFAAQSGMRLYRTGDRARFRADGVIEYLGRIDQQVKLRGFRIELGEIAATLRQHPQVHDAFVTIVEGRAAEKQIVAYVVGTQRENGEPRTENQAPGEAPRTKHQASEMTADVPLPAAAREGGEGGAGRVAELQNFLAAALPDYMLPGAFVFLDALPLTPNGKIDRRALPLPDLEQATRRDSFVGPRTPNEELIAGIWRKLLGVPAISVHDNFFALGGHSLLATRLIAQLRETFQLPLPLRAVFEHPTIAGLDTAIRAARQSVQPIPAPPLTPIEHSGDLPLSFAQQRLWFLDQFDPGHASYLIPLAVRIQGQLDVAALQQALNQVVARHAVLRTSFQQSGAAAGAGSDSRLIQVIHPQLTIRLSIHDMRGASVAEQMAALAAEAAQPFDLSRPPLLRAALQILGGDAYMLLLTLHHIITDGWSRSILVRDLIAFYESGTRSLPVALPELPIQYADYAIWQRGWLQGKILEQQLDYWRQQLADAPPVLELPTDRPRPAVRIARGEQLSWSLPASLSQALQDLSQAEGATLFMTLLAAFNVLLYRWSGQTDLVVGTPIAGRSQAATYDLIGCFVNTLVLRTKLAGRMRFRELLRQVRELCLGAYAHQDLPFELLVDTLQPERSLSYTPLFQVMLVLHNTPQPAIVLENMTIEPLEVATPTAKFDLTLTLTETEAGLVGGFEYSSDLFDAATIARLAAHLETLLAGIVADPQQPIGLLPLLPEAERHELLVTRQPKVSPVPAERCLHQLFEAQAARTPHHVALVHEQERLSYQELDSRANQLARYLRRAGVQPEARVGLYLERSPDLIIAMLAILKAGVAYVPIDPSYPLERVQFMLADMQAPLIVTQADLAARLASGSDQQHPTLIRVDADRDRIRQESTARVDVSVTPEQLAYVIYTSGSTGQPKGTLIGHAQAARLFSSTQPWFGFDERDVWTLFHSAAFDFSVWEIWGALLHGGRLVIVPYLTSRDPEAFYELLRAEQVTVLNQTPSAFRQLIAVDRRRDSTAEDLALRLVIFGGEALELQQLRPWFERHGDQRPQLVNMYGITETTVHVTYRPLTLADLEDQPRSLIGGPIPDLRLYICDPYGQPAPIGVAGELYVGGAGLAWGYLNRPALTAERFVPDPLGDTPGGRLYRSGDLARALPNGDIEYLGRIDQQIKLRGFRIELGEIEAALKQHPAVREAVTIVREMPAAAPEARQIVAYVVGEERRQNHSKELNSSALRRFLEPRLPEYMIPAVFVELESLPINANGKLDRSALPAPEQGRLHIDQPFVAPQTATEQILAAIWSQVLGLDSVGVHDNFFALGGDSIRSIQVLTALRERGLSCSLQQLFQHQTIHALAQAVTAAEASGAIFSQPFSLIADADRSLLPPDVEDAYPLTVLQAGMLFHSAYHPDTTLYENLSSFHLRVFFDEERLRAAIRQLLERHPVLRTSFDLSSFSQPLQLVHRHVAAPLLVTDLRHLTHDEQEARLTACFEEEQRRHFDWTAAPLLRFHVHRRSDQSFQFTLSEHHAILDGWSVAALLTELFQRYVALLGHGPAPDSASPVPFREFVALERQALESETQAEYWLARLADYQRVALPPWSWMRAAEIPAGVDPGQVVISAETSTGLQQLARAADVPLKSVLLAAHLRVLSLLSGQTDVVTGLVSNGRPETSGSEQTLGLFLNTLPLRFHLSGGSWIELARAVFAAERELLPFRRYPMGEIQRRLGGEPLFEIAFNFVHFHVYQQILAVRELEVLDQSVAGRTNFALVANVSIDPASSQIRLSLEYDPARLSPAQIAAIGGYYASALEAMAREPHQDWRSRSLLAATEIERLLKQWNASESRYPQELLVHQLVEAHAAVTPGALALRDGDRSLSYAELNIRANHLAHHLLRRGVEPETLVAVYAERSLELIVAALAVLKAGAAYVPIDPAYPPERVGLMLESAQAEIVLTQSRLRALLLPTSAQIVVVDQDWPPALPSDRENPVCRITIEHLAYAIYTSGSTGQPKGVAIPHAALLNLIAWHRQRYAVTAADRVTQLAGPGFDAAVWELWPSLASGASVHIVDANLRAEPARLLAWLAQERISICFMPTPLAELALAEPWPRASTLRFLLTGGDALRRYPPRDLPCALINHYGPTEYTVVTSSAEVDPDDQASGPPPIGHPIANTEIFVLDTLLQPVPVGVAGEVYIGGMGLARGYHGRPDLTAERFVPHPFAAAGGARLYKTGDLARYRPDGTLEFLGRIDQQVKLRGFRIELGEIEARLLAHPALVDAAAIVRETPAGRQIVAYVVEEQGSKGTKEQGNREPLGHTKEQLHAFLAAALPDYMLPAAFVFLDALPLTPNGKLDRRALPEPDIAERQRGSTLVAPRTPVERTLAGIWRELLGIPEVGVYDNFFALGGHSLLAVRLISQIRQHFAVQLPLMALFQAPTIEQLALALDRAHPTSSATIVPIQASGKNAPLFLIHPVGGSVLCYAELSAALGPEQPVYGVQSPGVEGSLPPAAQVENLAAQYLSAIRTAQPDGPYLLGGWSFGGLLAFEIARQLRAQHEQVAALLLLDTAAPKEAAPAASLDDTTLAAWFAEDLAGLAAQPDAIDWQRLRTLPPDRQLTALLAEARTLGSLPADIDDEQLRRLFAVFKAHVHAARAYRPQRYAGDLTLILPEQHEPNADPSFEWQALLDGKLAVQRVKGTHYTMLRAPQVRQIAELIRRSIDEALQAAAYSSPHHH
jgi:amino acid adenylation domain-containing protein